jgi:Ca-activated chloride channel family protein
MFLFSDGCANAGITSHQGICELVSKFYEKGVGVSSFGIGSDFDEKMMRGISDSGHGHYFFIDHAENIPKMLDKAFRGLSRTVATNVTLKIAGSKGRVVKKLSGNDDLFKGIALPDMREKDLKQIVLQLEVEESDNQEEVEILQFELSYDRLDECIPVGPIRGDLKLKVTNNFGLLNEQNGSVLVYLKINECAEMDKKVVRLMDENKLDEAINLKKEVINVLSGVADLDEVGFVKVLLMRAHNRVKELEALKDNKRSSSEDRQLVRKAMHKEALEEEDEDMGFGLFD